MKAHTKVYLKHFGYSKAGEWERNVAKRIVSGSHEKDMIMEIPKPVEGDVREEAIKVIEEYYANSIKDWTCEEMVDALLSKYKFTRKG